MVSVRVWRFFVYGFDFSLVCGSSENQVLPPNFIKLAKDVYTPDVIAASDCMLGKIGYGTVSEALAYRIPFVFVRRDYFNEEPLLRNILEAYYASSGFPTNSGFPTFINIKQLEIVYSRQDVYSQQDVSLTSLIEACPLMHTFKLKLMGRIQVKWPRKSLTTNSTQLKAISSHQHLKNVEYLGYAGCAIAAELALYLTRHAPMLGRFIFDTRQPQFIVSTCEDYTCDLKDQMEIVRSTTELLAQQIRASQGLADVVIL